MPVFIELTTDLFSEVFEQRSKDGWAAKRAGATSVRRPLRGLEIKEDTYAIIRVVDVSGRSLRMFDSSARRPDDPYHTENEGTQYSNFIIQSVQEARMEKNQIVETFGESYIFFFGEAPRFLDVQAVLLNTNDFNWEAEFWGNYETFWRGSKLTELGARMYLFYDDTIIEGYMLNATAVKDSMNPLSVQVQFRMFVTNYDNISFVDSDDFPIRSSVDASSVGLLDSLLGADLLKATGDLDSLQRGLAEEMAALGIQKAALSQFGGGVLLAEALRRGISPGMGPMLGGGAGFGVGASATASAGIGVSAGAFAGVSAGASYGANAQAFGGINAGAPPYTTGSYPGFAPAGFPNTQPQTFGASASLGLTPDGPFTQTSTTQDGLTTTNTSVNGQPPTTVTGPAGQGIYAPSPFYPPPTPGMPYSGAPLGANPFAPNPFAPQPFAPNSLGVNPYYPSPFAPTPFNPTGPGQPVGTRSNFTPDNRFAPPGTQLPGFGFPRDSIFGPGFRPFANVNQQHQPADTDPGHVRQSPLRGKIWENVDEWTGGQTLDNNSDFSEPPSISDVDDLPYSTFLLLGAYGVNLQASALGQLGMGPRFGPGGVGIGGGAGISLSASFGLGAGVSAGVGAFAGAGVSIGGGAFGGAFGVSASAGASAGIGPNGPYSSSFSTSGSGPVPVFNPYPNYPGYGSGYGSGFPGVPGGYAPGGQYGVGVSAGVTTGASFGGGMGGGAVVLVGGQPTCFALQSFPGTISAGGSAFISPDGTITTSSFTSGPDGATFSQSVDSL